MTQSTETRLDGTTLVVRIPMQFQRRGGRKRIVAPDGSAIVPSSKPQPDGTLVKALARAWRWQKLLDCRCVQLGDRDLRDRGDQQELCQQDPSACAAGAGYRGDNSGWPAGSRLAASDEDLPGRVGDAAQAALLRPLRRSQDRPPLPFSVDTRSASRDPPPMFFLDDNQLVWINLIPSPIRSSMEGDTHDRA
jgi:hypothetical protein